jgi:hypothetical protein
LCGQWKLSALWPYAQPQCRKVNKHVAKIAIKRMLASSDAPIAVPMQTASTCLIA